MKSFILLVVRFVNKRIKAAYGKWIDWEMMVGIGSHNDSGEKSAEAERRQRGKSQRSPGR